MSSRNINYSAERPYAWSKTGGAFGYLAIYFIKMSFCLPWNNNVARSVINDMWFRNVAPEIFHLLFHSNDLSADGLSLLLTKVKHWLLNFYRWLWTSLVEIYVPHKKSFNISSVSWSSCCKVRFTPVCWMAAAFHRFRCQQCFLLPLFLVSSLLRAVFSSLACLPAEPSEVFGPQLNGNTFFWEFWSESKLASWVLCPKSTWFHWTIFLLHFCLNFNFFSWGSLGFEDALLVMLANLSSFPIHFHSCLFLFSSWQTF